MKLNYFPLALALVVGVIIGVVVSGAAAETEAPQKSPLPNAAAPVPMSCPSVMSWRFADGSECVYRLQDAPVVTPETPATATDTPSPAPTGTASPTVTPSPTATHTVTATTIPTPVVVTPNTPTATATIEPTPTQEPPLAECVGAVLVEDLNVRAGPGTQYARIGQVHGGASGHNVELIYPWRLEFANTAPYKWVYFEGTDRQPNLDGWAAYSYHPGTTVPEAQIWIQLSASCDNLPTGDIPTDKTEVGPHTVLGAASEGIQRRGDAFDMIRVTTGTYYLGLIMRAVYGSTLVCRNVHANVPVDWGDPVGWYWNWNVAHWNEHMPDCDYYEIMNEASDYAPSWEVFAWFNLQMIKEAEKEGWGRKLLLFSFGPGHPDDPAYHFLEPVLDYIATHPANAQGETHGAAMHQSGYGDPDIHGWVNDYWVAARDYRMFNEFYRMKYHGLIPVYITELYWGDDQMIPCEKVAEGVYETLVVYDQPERIPTGMAIWNWGPWGGANLDPCTDMIADAVNAARG